MTVFLLPELRSACSGLPEIAMNPINPISPANISPIQLQQPGGLNQTPESGLSFKEFLIESIGHVNSMQQDANAAVEQLMTGGDANPAEVLSAVKKADMTFRLMLQIRNKLVQAYQEIKEIRI